MPSTASLRRRLAQEFDRETFTKRDGISWRKDGFPLMQSVLPAGKKGDATISHFTVSPKEASSFNFYNAFSGSGGLTRIEPGDYVRLHIGECKLDNLMMSDTPMERHTNWEVRRAARGQVLIAGLGIGMILHPILDPRRTREQDGGKYSGAPRLPAVEHVTVVELNQNVIDLVAPSLERYGDRLTIVQANIHDFDPGAQKYDSVYFDIWPHISGDNLPEIAKLHQRWKSRLNRTGDAKPWMSSWVVDYLRSERASEGRSRW